MSEVEKMYENANIKQDRMCEWTCKDSELCSRKCEHYESTQLYYPPFTAEKQLELIEFYIKSVWWLNLACFKSSSLPFNEELAKLTNHLWEDMTISQRKQIAEILRG